LNALYALAGAGIGQGGIILLAHYSFPPPVAEKLAEIGFPVYYREEPAVVIGDPPGFVVEEVTAHARCIMHQLIDAVCE
jgi:hypothetical protein